MPVIAAAQCLVEPGDIESNLARHLVFMAHAYKHGVGLLVFAELSLTGYEPTLAAGLAQPLDTPVLNPLRDFAREARLTTVVGLPLRAPGRTHPLIAACVLGADGGCSFYTKQYLHAGEQEHFSPGQGGALSRVDELPVALCVCADFSHARHASDAAQAGAGLYAASVLVGEGGYPADSALLKGHAERHRMAVLMANHGGPTGGWAAAGRSAFWDEQGTLVAEVAGTGSHLLVVRGQPGHWQGNHFPVPGHG